MRYLMPICLLFCLLATPAFADEPAELHGLSASYTAKLRLGEDGPLLPMRGTVAFTEGFLRVSVTQDMTMEEFIAIVDYGADTLTLLYPDTLNGKRYQLADFDHLDGFSRIRSVLEGETPKVPAGWQVEEEEIRYQGADCTLYRARSRDDDTLGWWVKPDGMPVKASLSMGETMVLVEVTKYDMDAAFDPARFAISEDYTITDSKDGVPPVLPSL